MRAHRVATAYGTDPYTVLTWHPDRLAIATACLEIRARGRIEEIEQAKPMAVAIVGEW
jgi:hypothetical protein